MFLEAGASGVAVVDRSTEALESAKKAIDGKFHEHLLLVQADVTDEVSLVSPTPSPAAINVNGITRAPSSTM